MNVIPKSEWLPCEQELRTLYSSNGLAYHNLSHIEDCLRQLNSVNSIIDRNSLELALWYHDVIYDPRNQNNEEASALFAAKQLKKRTSLSDEIISRVMHLIRVTDHQRIPLDEDEKTIVDIDLSILGAPPGAYASYMNKIREEYCFVGESKYKKGRIKVLEGFLGRDAIFRTSSFHERLEAKARKNLESEIARLSR